MNRILFFEEIEKTMVSRVGGKGANLGEMTGAGFPVPRGFCLTTEIYDAFAEGLSLEDLAGEEARSLLRQRNLHVRQRFGRLLRQRKCRLLRRILRDLLHGLSRDTRPACEPFLLIRQVQAVEFIPDPYAVPEILKLT